MFRVLLDLLNLPLIIGHRGASAVAPENTLAAFERALADGVDGIECDVRLAGDSVPVVFHDQTLKRCAFEEIAVSLLSSRELARVDVGTWFNLKHEKHARACFKSETVPTLWQFFELMRGNDKIIYTELKCEIGEAKRFARAVAELLSEFDFLPRVVVKSFDHDCLCELKKLLPKTRIAALYKPHPLRVMHPGRRMVKPALRIGAEELSLHYSLATNTTVRKAHLAGLKTVIWTADHPAWIKRAAKIGIHAVITNNPARLLDKRREFLAAQIKKV